MAGHRQYALHRTFSFRGKKSLYYFGTDSYSYGSQGYQGYACHIICITIIPRCWIVSYHLGLLKFRILLIEYSRFRIREIKGHYLSTDSVVAAGSSVYCIVRFDKQAYQTKTLQCTSSSISWKESATLCVCFCSLLHRFASHICSVVTSELASLEIEYKAKATYLSVSFAFVCVRVGCLCSLAKEMCLLAPSRCD